MHYVKVRKLHIMDQCMHQASTTVKGKTFQEATSKIVKVIQN